MDDERIFSGRRVGIYDAGRGVGLRDGREGGRLFEGVKAATMEVVAGDEFWQVTHGVVCSHGEKCDEFCDVTLGVVLFEVAEVVARCRVGEDFSIEVASGDDIC